jgi:predicted RND superfamily exporter protein
MERYFGWVTRRRRLVVLIGAGVAASAAFAARGLEIDYSVEQFFPTWGEERALFDEYREVFAREDAQVVFLLETSDGLDGPSYGLLAVVADAFRSEELEEIWWAGRLAELSDAAGDGAALARAYAELRSDPRFAGFLWNEAGSVQTVQALLPPELNDDAHRRDIASRLGKRLAELDIGARWTLSGTPMLRAQVPELLERDQTVLLSGGIVLFFVVLYLFVGHAGRVLLSLAAVLPAYLVTLALMAELGKPVTIMTSFIPIVILVVGVCDSTHLLVHFARHRKAGMTPPEAATATFAELASSCFFTSLTTALGFSSLVATGIGVIADFGVFTALAVMATFAFTVSLLPALLAFGGNGAWAGAREPARRLVRAPVRLARLVARGRPEWPLAAFTLVVVPCVFAGRGLAIDAYLVDDLKDDTRIIQDLRWIEHSGFALFQTNVFLRADAADMTHPAMLAWMERLQRAVEREPIVASTFGLPDLLRAAARRGAELEPGAVSGLMSGVYRPDADAAQIVVTVADAGSRRTLPFLDRLNGMLRESPPPFGSARVTGTVVMAHTFSSHVLRSFGPSILLALVLIWLIMTLLFRSMRLGLVALVPNVFPLVVLAGAMVALGVSLKPSSILVFSIAFGIAVDDSIHLMGRFGHLLARGHSRERALRRALRDTGPALVMSTVVVSAGFSLLLLSRFQLLHLVGLLTATTAMAALVADLFLFPALLRMVPPRQSLEAPAALVGSSRRVAV